MATRPSCCCWYTAMLVTLGAVVARSDINGTMRVHGPNAAHGASSTRAGSTGTEGRTNGCDLTGEWSFNLIRASSQSSGWSSWPHTYNMTHDVSTGKYQVPSAEHYLHLAFLGVGVVNGRGRPWPSLVHQVLTSSVWFIASQATLIAKAGVSVA